jgi:hypothetical protein
MEIEELEIEVFQLQYAHAELVILMMDKMSHVKNVYNNIVKSVNLNISVLNARHHLLFFQMDPANVEKVRF